MKRNVRETSRTRLYFVYFSYKQLDYIVKKIYIHKIRDIQTQNVHGLQNETMMYTHSRI